MSLKTEEFFNNVMGFLACKSAVEATAKVACFSRLNVFGSLLVYDIPVFLSGLLAEKVHGVSPVV